MFNKLGQLASLMKNLPRIQEEAQKFQDRLGEMTADSTAGGGMVTARVNGKMQLLACSISPDALALNDREMLEDLIIAAVNAAVEKIRTQIAEETSKMAEDLGVPANLRLPGIG